MLGRGHACPLSLIMKPSTSVTLWENSASRMSQHLFFKPLISNFRWCTTLRTTPGHSRCFGHFPSELPRVLKLFKIRGETILKSRPWPAETNVHSLVFWSHKSMELSKILIQFINTRQKYVSLRSDKLTTRAVASLAVVTVTVVTTVFIKVFLCTF